MEAEIRETANKLIQAIEIIMNPMVSQQQRAEAYEICENFKDHSPLCAQCGLFLSAKPNSPIVRHFGLQLIEHCIKFRWNDFKLEEKVFIKENAMNLLKYGTESILVEQTHIKDALSRIIVEMIKREWPQNWPTLLAELEEICLMGVTQKELVLLIFLRLAEDIVAFHNVQQQRRREIYQSLSANLSGIFGFFLTCLRTHVQQCNELDASSNPEIKQQSKIHARVAETALMTLTGFVEWVPFNHIIVDNNVLLKMLCCLLSNEQLRIQAAECLLLIMGRKGKAEERKPLLVLFTEDAMSVIFSSARVGMDHDQYYVFLKKLCQLITALGTQLCSIWGILDDVGPPETFPMYLKSILFFTDHPSQVLSNYTQSLWLSFFRHEHISKDPEFQAMIPKYIEISREKLLRVGLPSRNDSPSCDYSLLDFDSDDDFSTFFYRYRSEIAENLRSASLLCPKIAFEYVRQWLTSQLEKPIELEEGVENGLCTLNSPSALQWDALAVFMESILGKVFQSSEPKPTVEEGLTLLRLALAYDTRDPVILSSLLSCISALLVFVSEAPEFVPAVLEKIFSAAVFSLPGQTRLTRSKTVKNVRRHACSSMVKICKQSPQLLLSSFQQIYDFVKNLSADPDQLSQMEKCTLIEALILISNEFGDFARQSAFFQEILASISLIMQSPEFENAISSAENFIKFTGLDKAPVDSALDDIPGANRSQLIYFCTLLVGIVKRSKWPDDPDIAKRGGFAKEASSSTTLSPCFCNPATTHLVPLFKPMLSLLRVQNSIFSPENRKKVHPEFGLALEMMDSEKNNLLGIIPAVTDVGDVPSFKQPQERMQNFLTVIHTNCVSFIGSAGPSLGPEFYAIPDLANLFLNSVFKDLQHIPDYRLRSVIRYFLKPFVQHCPRDYFESSLNPVLAALCPYMYQLLNTKWQNFKCRYGTSVSYEDEMTETQEVIEDQLNRQLTREYIDLLAMMLHNRRGVDQPVDAMDEDLEQAKPPSQSSDVLTEMGMCILRSEKICPYLVMTVFSALSWLDSITSLKTSQLCWPILKQLTSDNLLQQPDEAVFLFQSVLNALQEVGQHEANKALLIGLGLQIYEHLRPQFPVLASVLHKAVGGNENDIKLFDEKVLPPSQMPEKRKKDLFKKVVGDIIGKSLGEKFMKPVVIKNLSPMFQRPKPKLPSVDELEESDIGLGS